jgi:hypothetical protein
MGDGPHRPWSVECTPERSPTASVRYTCETGRGTIARTRLPSRAREGRSGGPRASPCGRRPVSDGPPLGQPACLLAVRPLRLVPLVRRRRHDRLFLGAGHDRMASPRDDASDRSAPPRRPAARGRPAGIDALGWRGPGGRRGRRGHRTPAVRIQSTTGPRPEARPGRLMRDRRPVIRTAVGAAGSVPGARRTRDVERRDASAPRRRSRRPRRSARVSRGRRAGRSDRRRRCPCTRR